MPAQGSPASNLTRQVLILEDFPSPLLARALSPNGRVHWAARSQARRQVATRVLFEAAVCHLRPMHGPVRVLFRYTRPRRGRVDLDNLTTGVSKACLDALVRIGVLEDDDSEHVVGVAAEVRVETGRRALEIVIEEAGDAD